jgi:hypothetical protein
VRGLLTIIDEIIGEKPGVSQSCIEKHNIKVVDGWRPFVNEHFAEIVSLVDPSSQPMDTTISDDDDDDA